MEKRKLIWSAVFRIVVVVCILQYIFMSMPRVLENPHPAYIIGSILPNGIIIFIFWLIKRKAEKI